MSEVKINRNANSITFTNNNISFSQFGIAKEILDLIENQQQEIERLHSIIKEVREYIEEHIKYECDDAFNGKQFYSYHLYDFDKKELLGTLDKEVN